MKHGDITFLKAIGWMIGVNVLINILPTPWDMLTLTIIFGYFIWQLYKDTRY